MFTVNDHILHAEVSHSDELRLFGAGMDEEDSDIEALAARAAVKLGLR
jgi:hypothetical protein